MTQNATDFENQVVNLVKAAMSGDEEANDVIVQIIEAAKKGDEQALKVVALIKQLTQSNSDQAEEGAEENTEVMKCGGKVRAKMKAKKSTEKKEEGGEIPEEKCGGTAKKMRKAVCKAKKCEEGDKLTDTQKFLLGAKCGAKMKKPKKCESGDHIEELEDYLAVKCGGKMKKTKKHEEGGQISLDFSQIDFAKCGKKLKKKEDGGEIAEEKCGGKAKKVKKGEVGVRLPEGAHGKIWSKSISSTTIFSKGGKQCPCALKRVGGKIVTVDSCTGLPIHKNGGNVNYLQTGGEMDFSERYKYSIENNRPVLLDRYNSQQSDIAVRSNPNYLFTPNNFEEGDGLMSFYTGTPRFLTKRDNLNPYYQLDLESGKPVTAYGQHEDGNIYWSNLKENSVGPDGVIRKKPTPEEASENRQKYQQEYQQRQEAEALANRRINFYSRYSPGQIENIKKALKRQGYFVSNTNGQIDNETINAVLQFQKDRKLSRDGMAGKNTLAQLFLQPVRTDSKVQSLTVTPNPVSAENENSKLFVKQVKPQVNQLVTDQAPTAESIAQNITLAAKKQGGILNYSEFLGL